ncbi:MAG: ABC transporter permease [archaeon]
MILEYFQIAFNSIRQRRLRSWLTMLGIFIGIAAVVSLISLSQGLQNGITDQFKKLGADKLTVQLAGSMGDPSASFTAAKLTEKDANAIKKVKGVDAVSGRLLRVGKVMFNDITTYTAIAGLNVMPEDLKILEGTGFTDIESGRFIKDSDKTKVMIGNDYKASGNTFKKEVRVGDSIEINGRKFEVVGILKKSGVFFIDSALIINKEVLRDLLQMQDEEVSVVAVRIQEGEDINKVSEDVEKKLRSFRNVEKGKEDFRVSTPQQILNTFLTVFNIVTGVIIGIAAISLLVGGIGIMNTMYTSILERTREIGIMKAIGARNSNIFWLFFIESGLLGMAGGIIGIIIGLSMSKSVELIAASYFGNTLISASFSPILIFGALAFSFIVGTLAGTLPAIQASKLHPVQALRK